jgi:aryl-alcohol dehydrogenase-like predicted oxidoreductase
LCKPQSPIKSVSEYYPPAFVIEQAESALRRLKRNHIDILHLHNWYAEWNREANEVLSVFQSLKQAGKIRAIGISIPRWSRVDIANLTSDRLIDVVQIPFNLSEQWSMNEIAVPASRDSVAVLARSPLDHGVLGSLGSQLEGISLDDFRFRMFGGSKSTETQARISSICRSIGITERELPYYAIGYCLSQPEITSTIVGMSKIAQVIENVSSSNYMFDQEKYFLGQLLSMDE